MSTIAASFEAINERKNELPRGVVDIERYKLIACGLDVDADELTEVTQMAARHITELFRGGQLPAELLISGALFDAFLAGVILGRGGAW